MKKTISAMALASLLTATVAYGSGYRIPEQSADSTAKAGSHIAGALGADAAYYNPANMSWMENKGWLVEGDLSYIYLSPIDYEDNRSSAYDHESEDENFLLPALFVVSPDYNGVHFGFSITVPYGLSKRWKDGYGQTFARNFSLKVFDINPTVSYKINKNVSFAAGARMLYAEGTVRSDGVVSPPSITASRHITVDAVDFGWNAALSIRPSEESNVSITYRSNVDLEFEGDATLRTNAVMFGNAEVDTNTDVMLPAPAVLSLSGTYDFGKTKVEVTIDRTFWSEFEGADFEYDTPITNPVLYSAFDRPSIRNWEDTTAYRLGIEYELDDAWTLMGGLAYDENPVPEEHLNFDLPDSDAWLFSIGARHKLDEKSQIAFAILYDYKESREVENDVIDGEFSGASAILATVGYSYEF